MATVSTVKAFLSEGQDRKVTTAEFMEFWKSCTPEQQEEYKAAVG